MAFKKGQSGNPGGRPAILPEVRFLIDKEKNSVRILIIELLSLTKRDFEARETKNPTMTEFAFLQCIQRICTDGNIDAYRKLLEIVMGKLPEDKDPFYLSDEEKAMVLEYRQRMQEERDRHTISVDSEVS